jgi:hypothetical protein
MAAAAVFLGLLVWVIYLHYLLARRRIESTTELEKHRLELEFKQGFGAAGGIALENRAGLVTWEGEILPGPDAPSRPAQPTETDFKP